MPEKDNSQQYEAYLNDRRADALEEFFVTGQPTALAEYLENEGKLTEGIRRALISILRGERTITTKGGKNAWRDRVTYTTVRYMHTKGKMSKTAACTAYAKQTNQTVRTVEKQYERGNKFDPLEELKAE